MVKQKLRLRIFDKHRLRRQGRNHAEHKTSKISYSDFDESNDVSTTKMSRLYIKYCTLDDCRLIQQ